MARAERQIERVFGAVLLMVTTTAGLYGCLSPGPTTVPPPEFTTASPRVSSRPTPPPGATVFTAQRPLADEFQPEAPPRDWKYLVLHHSATAQGSVASIDAEHRQRRDAQGNPWLGIGYHFVVGNGQGMPDGQIEATFRWQRQLHGAHAGNEKYNQAGIGICLIGNFEQQPPTTRQIAATRKLISTLAERFEIEASQIVLHRDVSATKCPGRHFQRELFVTRARLPHTPGRLETVPLELASTVSLRSRPAHSPSPSESTSQYESHRTASRKPDSRASQQPLFRRFGSLLVQ